MSSNIPLTHSTGDKNQDQKMAQTKVPSLDKSGSALETLTEHTEKLDSKKIYVPSLGNQGLLGKLKHNAQRN